MKCQLQPFLNDDNITASDKQGKNYTKVSKMFNFFFFIHVRKFQFSLLGKKKKGQVYDNSTLAKDPEDIFYHLK